MKKLALSLTVVGIFIFYSAYLENKSALQATLPRPSTSPSPTTPFIQLSPTTIPDVGMMSSRPMGQMMGQYKDGVFTGDVVDVFYGNVQVEAIIQSGRLSDVKFLQSPNDRNTSVMINSEAMPMLAQEAIQAQSAAVDGVSGASATSQGFITSLSSALVKAK